MLTNRKRQITALLLSLVLVAGATAKSEDRVVSAKGKGTLKVGKEEFNVNAVTVKLLQNGKAEINLISEISIFVSGTWSQGNVSTNEINVKLTEGAAGDFEGSGKVFLGYNQTKIVRLSLQGASRTSKRPITVDFVAEE
jgi:hypothetical protein